MVEKYPEDINGYIGMAYVSYNTSGESSAEQFIEKICKIDPDFKRKERRTNQEWDIARFIDCK